MEITANELVGLIELNKKRAELEFKRSVLGQPCQTETLENKKQMDAFCARTKGFVVVLPNQRRLDDLGKVLSGYGPAEMKEALRTRSGPAYDAFMQRGAIVKANTENRFEIAKLNLEIADLKDEDKAKALEVLKLGAIFGPIAFISADDAAIKRIAKFMRRCGIPCVASGKQIVASSEDAGEVRMTIANRMVWVSDEVRKKLEENLKRTQAISMKVQLRNAERQVLSFDDAQEKDFTALQHEYLGLLKEQDDLLKDYLGEERKEAILNSS
jgi:hypothetical protein